MEFVSQNDLFPILHNPEIENPNKFYDWNSNYIIQNPNFDGIQGVSCHNLTNIKNAQRSEYDYIFLISF